MLHAATRQALLGLPCTPFLGFHGPVMLTGCCAVETPSGRAMQVTSLAPATHAYSFWEGIPVCAKSAFGRLFAASPDVQGVAVVQRAMRGREPAHVMAELGFGPLQLVGSFAVSMSGGPPSSSHS